MMIFIVIFLYIQLLVQQPTTIMELIISCNHCRKGISSRLLYTEVILNVRFPYSLSSNMIIFQIVFGTYICIGTTTNNANIFASIYKMEVMIVIKWFKNMSDNFIIVYQRCFKSGVSLFLLLLKLIMMINFHNCVSLYLVVSSATNDCNGSVYKLQSLKKMCLFQVMCTEVIFNIRSLYFYHLT